MKIRFPILAACFLSLAFAGEVDGQWIQRSSGTHAVLTDIGMLDSNTAYLVNRERAVLRTTDAGVTWGDLTAPLSYVMPWNAVFLYDSANGIAVGDQGAVLMIVGQSAGSQKFIPGAHNCLSALQASPAEIYVGDDSGWVHYSPDSGKTWSSERISEWPVRSVFALRGVSETTHPLYALTSHSICVKQDPSAQWEETFLEAFQEVGAEAFEGQFAFGGGEGFIVGFGGDTDPSPVVLRKLPSDSLWRSVPCGNKNNGPLYGLSVPSGSVIYACGRAGMIIKSSDGGESWSQHTPPVAAVVIPDLNAISFSDVIHGFAAGNDGSILYTCNGGLTRVFENGPNLPNEFVLEQNFPNPFNPSTTFRYRLPTVSRTTLVVHDVLGRKVRTLVNALKGPGIYSAILDGTTLPAGVYFCRLTAASVGGGPVSYIQTKKAVLIK